MKNANYFNERDVEIIKKTEAICEELPEYVSDFFLKIQMRSTPLTRFNYASDLRIFFRYLQAKKFNKEIIDITLSDLDFVTAKDLEKFLMYLSNYTYNGKTYSCKESAKERKLCSVRSFFRYLFKEDLLSSNIAEKVESVKIHEKPILYLENSEVNDLLDITETGYGLSNRQKTWHEKTSIRDFAIISLFLGTGMRISELVGINKDDIDYSVNAVKVTRKGGKQNILYFPQEVADAINNYLDWLDNYVIQDQNFAKNYTEKNALFISMKGNRITTRAVENLVKKYSKIVTPVKKITPHKLRSTFGTSLYRNTHDIYIVADVLGHKDINTTKKHYAAISDDLRKNAVKNITIRKPEENDEN